MLLCHTSYLGSLILLSSILSQYRGFKFGVFLRFYFVVDQTYGGEIK